MTTNEKVKRSALVRDIKYNIQFFEQWHSANKNEKAFELTEKQKDFFEVTGDESAGEVEEKLADHKDDLKSV